MPTIQFRRDTAANWTTSNPTLLVGELGIETDTYKIKMGDGSTAWTSLGYLTINAGPYAIVPVQGTARGFSAGGYTGSSGQNAIETFSFTSDANASDWGDLTAVVPSQGCPGISDVTNSNVYANIGSWPATAPGGKTVNKYSSASAANATSGDVVATRKHVGGGGAMSTEKGYLIGGSDPAVGGYDEKISAFPFASEGTMTNVGDMVDQNPYEGYGFGTVMNPTTVYLGGGSYGANMIQKFTFASEGQATDTGGDMLTADKRNYRGNYGPTHGFFVGGYPPEVNVIQSFPFAADSSGATDVANLTSNLRDASDSSSTTHGYQAGGKTPTTVNTIQKFATTGSGADATDVGDLATTAYDGVSGQV